ncbi:MAG: hypothetical protein LBF12_04120 [Christensenellaceae bacterium]|nr:hypothetical protein [Christensenellaceae bacterium]
MDCVYELFATPANTPGINKLLEEKDDEFEYFLKVAEIVGRAWFVALNDPDNVPRLYDAASGFWCNWADKNKEAIEAFYKGVIEEHDSVRHPDGYVPKRIMKK